MPTASGVLVSQATALQVSAVYACVRIRARDLARCTPQVLRDDGKGNKAIVAEHPLAALFRKPNRVQPWFAFAEQMHAALMLRSNAYAAILRDWRGRPTELIPLNPDLVTPMEAPDGSLFYSVSRAGLWLQAVLADTAIVIPGEDVLHLRDLTFNTLVGVARIALARDAIGLAMVQEQQAGRWAGNGARPAGVLQSDKTLSPEAASRLRQQWDQMQSGVQNAGRTAILEDGLKWAPMALSSVDLEFGSARLYQVKEVARFFEVPLHKLGENESLPRASIAELNADYVQNTVMSDATRWEQMVSQHFGITEEGLEVKLDEKALLRADLATMTNAARTGVLSGLLTQNEGRAIIGYGPMDEADKLLAPVNLAPHGSAADGVAPDGAGRPPAGLNPGDMKALVAGMAKAVAAELRRGNPAGKPLYVSRDLLNADDVVSWAKSQGFKTTLATDDMHVTIAYSKAAVDWSKVDAVSRDLEVDGGARSIHVFGEGAVVLQFECASFSQRWQAFRDIGASWDYPEYRPHITLTYDAGDVDLDDVEPFSGALVFGPEIFAEIDEDWRGKVREESFNPNQPRDPHTGEWSGDNGDGSNSEGGAAGDTFEATHAALSHEIKLAVKATALVAAVALAPFVLPEAVAGSFVVAGALAAADGIAFDMYVRAGVEAGKHALNDMGVDTSAAEKLVAEVGDLTKAADSHQAKLRARLAPILAGAADLARDTLVTDLKAKRPTTPDEMIATIDAARDTYRGALSRFGAVKMVLALLKYRPDQLRDELGRWASEDDDGNDDSAPAPHQEEAPKAAYPPYTTRQKVWTGVFLASVGLWAIDAATHRKTPFRSRKLEKLWKRDSLRAEINRLNAASVHTPLSEAERTAIKTYASTDIYKQVNKSSPIAKPAAKSLRLGHKPTELVKNIDAAIAKSAISENTVVYRGLNKDRSNRIIRAGSEFVDKGFVSTSIYEPIAREQFAKKSGYVVSMNVEKGAQAFPIGKSDAAYDDFEVLLPRSSAFKILRVDHDTKTIYAQHLGVATGKMAPKAAPAATGETVGSGDEDRFLWDIDELDVLDPPEGDTTAFDYAGYVPPQPADDDPAFGRVARSMDSYQGEKPPP